MRMNWDLIPTQSQSSHRSCHQPLAYDNNQSHRVKAGSAGKFMDTTQERIKIAKGNKVSGGKRIYESREYKAVINLFDAYAPVYENPPDRVFRNGKWVLITELNEATRKHVAIHGVSKRDDARPSQARNKRHEAAIKEQAEILPARQRKLVGMREAASLELFGNKL